MIEELMGAYGGRLVIAVLGVAVGLICLIGILWVLRGRNGPSPFVRGGRNRNPRLQVLDAAAVDARRRLVLVRRDDMEHLIMIGGPTDIVIESGIRAASPPRLSTEGSTISQASLPPAASAAAAVSDLRAPNQARLAAPMGTDTRDAEPRVEARVPETRFQAREQQREAALQENAAREAASRPAPRPPAPPVAAPSAPAAPSVSLPASVQATAGNLASSPAPNPAATAAAPSTAEAPPQRSEPATPPQASPEIKSQPAGLGSASFLGAGLTGRGLDEAASALEAVRARVLQERGESGKAAPVEAASAPPVAQEPAPQQQKIPTPAATQTAEPVETPKALGSDFEQILEEEMANNLAEREAAASARRPALQAPQRDVRSAPVTGATADPSLQDEVARIFGEMSVTRDK
jgi:hypothetical protein